MVNHQATQQRPMNGTKPDSSGAVFSPDVHIRAAVDQEARNATTKCPSVIGFSYQARFRFGIAASQMLLLKVGYAKARYKRVD